MKAWTINEQAREGIQISTGEDALEPAVLIGTGKAQVRFPVSRELRELFCEAYFKREDKEERITEAVQVGPMGLVSMRLKRCNLRDDRACLTVPFSEPNMSARALVLVETNAGHKGRLWFTDIEAVSEECDGRVKRVNRAFPPPGVDVIVSSKGPLGEPHSLLMMVPGARFLIHRTGYIPEEEGMHAAPVLRVEWTGNQLKCLPLRRYLRRVA